VQEDQLRDRPAFDLDGMHADMNGTPG
jgi:hypothetical protein